MTKAKQVETQPPSGRSAGFAERDAYRMLRTSIAHPVLDAIGDGWVLAIVGALLVAPASFEEIVSGLGVPRSTLSNRLRHMQSHHLLEEGAREDRLYALSSKGRDLIILLRMVEQWDSVWATPRSAAMRVVAPNACGHHAPILLGCAHCSGKVHAQGMKILMTRRNLPAADLPTIRRARVLEKDEERHVVSAQRLIADRWTGMISAAAFLGTRKYSDFLQALGIGPNVLAGRLERMLQDGVMERVRYSDTSDRQEYRLTERGLATYPIVVALLAWGHKWVDPEDDPGWAVLHKNCVEWFEPVFVCAECEAPAL